MTIKEFSKFSKRIYHFFESNNITDFYIGYRGHKDLIPLIKIPVKGNKEIINHLKACGWQNTKKELISSTNSRNFYQVMIYKGVNTNDNKAGL